MQPGDIVLLSISQADGQVKNRPVLLLKKMPPFNDWLVCGISSQLKQESKGFDYVILESDSVFSQTGLKSASLIRLGFLAVFSQKSIPGSIGNIDNAILKILLKRLSNHLIG